MPGGLAPGSRARADAGIVRGVTGVYDMTPDARPLLGQAARPGRADLAAGFSGMGFKIAPAVGEGIAGLIARRARRQRRPRAVPA